jgi:hypothetical protein
METMLVANVLNAEKIYQRQITKLGLSNSMFPLLLMRVEVDPSRSQH